MAKGKKGGDGLTDRERAFVRVLREKPGTSWADAAQEAGFQGSRHVLAVRGCKLIKKALVMHALLAPRERPTKLDDESLREELRGQLLAIVRNARTTDADKIKAVDKLLATVPGGYVPIQLKTDNSFTLEGFVRAAGGAPPALAAGQPSQEE